MRLSRKGIIKIIVIILLLGLLSFAYLTRPKSATLVIESIPPTKIFINGQNKGNSPKEIEVEPGDLLLTLEPADISTESYSKYETRVKTTAGTKTIVRRILGEEEEKASGEIISFEKSSHDSADFSIISIPDGSQVFIDNKFIDSTPLKVSDLSPGVHSIEIKAQGYVARQFEIQITKGFNLTAIVDLSKLNDSASFMPTNLAVKDESNNEENDDENLVKLRILPTPTDYLRVRELPTTNSRELGQVRPGQTYEYLQTSEDKQWHQIQFKEEIKGWINSEYSQILDGGSSGSTSI